MVVLEKVFEHGFYAGQESKALLFEKGENTGEVEKGFDLFLLKPTIGC